MDDAKRIEVHGCKTCHFVEEHMDPYCGHPDAGSLDDLSWRYFFGKKAGDPPELGAPDWCPLRKAPALLVWAGGGGDE